VCSSGWSRGTSSLRWTFCNAPEIDRNHEPPRSCWRDAIQYPQNWAILERWVFLPYILGLFLRRSFPFSFRFRIISGTMPTRARSLGKRRLPTPMICSCGMANDELQKIQVKKGESACREATLARVRCGLETSDCWPVCPCGSESRAKDQTVLSGVDNHERRRDCGRTKTGWNHGAAGVR